MNFSTDTAVAICEQIGDPATNKGPVERKVVRVVTPGTLTDSDLLPEKSDRPLLALCVVPKKKQTLLGLAVFGQRQLAPDGTGGR